MRVDSFDGLRGFAILLVIYFHSFFPYSSGGFIGVDIFFVLSGFLITILLIKEYKSNLGIINFKYFYIRRSLRLIPALLTVVIFYYIYNQLFGNTVEKEISLYASLSSLFYVANFAKAFEWYNMGWLLPTWSLSVEEHFYLIWPLLFLLLIKQFSYKKNLIFSVVLIIILLSIHRIVLALNEVDVLRLYYSTDTHSTGLLTGCLFAILIDKYENSRFFTRILMYKKPILFTAFSFYIISTLLADSHSHSLYIWFFPALELISAILICSLYLDRGNTSFLLSNKALIALGKISYGLYLWHWIVFRILEQHFTFGPYLPLAGMVVSVFIASLSYSLIEMPFLRFKDNFSQKGNHVSKPG